MQRCLAVQSHPLKPTPMLLFVHTLCALSMHAWPFKPAWYCQPLIMPSHSTAHARHSVIASCCRPDTRCAVLTGMNSATTMLLALVPAGGHIITTTDCYRRTRQFIQTVLPKMGVTATVLDPSDLVALERTLEQHETSVYFSESPTNPYLRYSPFEHAVCVHAVLYHMFTVYHLFQDWRSHEW